MVATVPSCETLLLFWGLVALVGGGWWRDSGCDGGHDGARDGSGARVSGGLCHRLWAGGGGGEREPWRVGGGDDTNDSHTVPFGVGGGFPVC